MKKIAKLKLNRETLRVLTLDVRSLQEAVGGVGTYTCNSCAFSQCPTCMPAPSAKTYCIPE